MTTDSSGMTREEWERTDVHKASEYFCSRCGMESATPEELYAHLDANNCSQTRPIPFEFVIPDVAGKRAKRSQPRLTELLEHLERFGPDQVLESAEHLPPDEFEQLRRACRQEKKGPRR